MTLSKPNTPPGETPGYLQRILERRAALEITCGELYPEPSVLTLELGCGHGHYLTAYAQAFPDQACLGVDLVTKRIAKATAKAEKRALANLHFLKAEASELLEALPTHVNFQNIFMLFPDPWPKKRHFKNRMVQPELLSKLAKRATAKARFHFRTDHEGYFQWAHEVVQAHPAWNITGTPWPFEEGSYFQDMMSNWQSLIAEKA